MPPSSSIDLCTTRPPARRSWQRALAGMAASLLVAACATLPPQVPADRMHAGRFAVTTTLDGHSDNSTGRFTLAVRGERLTLDLATPLGTTLARVDSGPDGAQLQTQGASGLQQARGPDAGELATELLGYPLPVAGIADWIEGRAAPQRPAQTLVRDDGLPRFVQDGWTIEVSERYPSGGVRRLVFARPAQPGSGRSAPIPAITLRLVLDEHPAAASPDASLP